MQKRMLRPFKSFLNNLQKNAETFFGSKQNSPDMNPNPEEEEEIAAENMYNIDELDALVDPLALDDELSDRNLESVDLNTFTAENTNFDSSNDGKIILVDVNSLKSSFSIAETFDSSINIDSHSSASIDDVNKHHCTEDQIKLSEQDESNAKTNFDSIVEEAEGARSDGSDSGLGLELCVGLSEKSNDGTAVRGNLKRRSDTSDRVDQSIELKKPKRNIQFTGVTVYYFPRIQGFTCVPSQGGCTLGMGSQHCEEKSFSLSEHAAQKRLQMLEKNPKQTNSMVLSSQSISITPLSDDRSRSSTEESESDEDNLSDNSESELDTEPAGFLQPVSQKQRRALLKSAGVRDIVSYEKNECRDIRASREVCGCSCRGYCDAESCLCSRNGIKCQVDRASFPCGCTQDGCGNVYGRVEFNPKRVRTHFIHTIMRLELEKKQKKCDKQNTLQSYDGRLRLRESDEESNSTVNTTIIHNKSSLGRLVNYSPANNILYPTSTIQSSSSVIINPIDSQHSYSSSMLDDPNRINCIGKLGESSFDLQYEYRSEYVVDLPSSDSTHSSFSLIYPSTSYYSPDTGSSFPEYTANKISLQPSFPIYSSAVPYDSQINGNSLQLSVTANVSDTSENSSKGLSYVASTTGEHCNNSYYNSNQSVGSTPIQTIQCIHQSGSNYESIPKFHSEASVMEKSDASAFLSNDQLPTLIDVDSRGDLNDASIATVISGNTSKFPKYASDFANKLSHSYHLPDNLRIHLERVDDNKQQAPEQNTLEKQSDDCLLFES